MNDNALTVSELTDRVKALVEDTIGNINVVGEISNYKHHSSGHRYFTLKDENAQLRCVFFKWKAESLTFHPQDGMSVIAAGKMTVYKPHGTYQLDVNRLFPSGIGALEMAFRELKERLLKEGLFEKIHKKPLPEFPINVGVITSPTGAAVRDFIRTLHNRSPWINIIIRPTRVQGEGAAADIARAVAEFNRYSEIDLIVITRGGGSLEDLWAFNEEVVARAVFDSEIPIVSAVGHEVDFTICDFVADIRAATPTAAAELIAIDKKILQEQISRIKTDLLKLLLTLIESKRSQLKSIATHRAFQKPLSLFEQYSIKLDHLNEKLDNSVKDVLNSHKVKLTHLQRELNSVSPDNVLRRGYSICTTEKDEVVKDSEQLRKGDRIKLKFASGGADSEVSETYN
ncbi:MAG: exodeoxyribonuclease VII large subunit [candidate division Zixibacteria bacterium]|nr:exodeoxyribonuclease VII large subunit [candidate division Zixibacteria bacterium]